jgi:hypothetical protein
MVQLQLEVKILFVERGYDLSLVSVPIYMERNAHHTCSISLTPSPFFLGASFPAAD